MPTLSAIAAPEPLLDALEQRVLLANSPLPTLDMLDDPNDSVVRLETRYGDIDLEVLAGAAPVTSATFLTLLKQGAYSETFFHSLEAGARLRGGLIRFDDDAGLSQREGTLGADATPTQSNLEMTVAMPVDSSGASPTTTGEIVFNLGDNSASDADFAVFARVVQGWNVVLQIAALPVLDLSSFFTDPIGATLTQVPVTSDDPPPTSVDRSLLVSLTDAQIIKRENVQAFYSQKIYFPEGYSWERVFEAVDLLNPGENGADYQVLVRYETGQRDQVVTEGSLDAHRRDTITVAPGFGRMGTAVRAFTPYSYELWSTEPLAAGFRHKDFKSGFGESFFRPESLPDRDAMHEWSFNQVAMGAGHSHVFLIWQNTTDQDAAITVTFYFQNADPVTHTFTLAAHRRGGVDVRTLDDLPAGDRFRGAVVSADQDIVAAVSRYDVRDPAAPGDDEHDDDDEEFEHSGGNGSGGDEGGRGGLLQGDQGEDENEGHGLGDAGRDDEFDRRDQGGVGALGTPGGGATAGTMPIVRRRHNPLTILNAGDTDSNVTLIVLEEGSTTPTEHTVVVPAGRLLVLQGNENPAEGSTSARFLTLRYSSDTPVTVGLVTKNFRGAGTGAETFASTSTHFPDARGFTAPRGSAFGRQMISIDNPGDAAATITITITFSRRDPITLPAFTLGAGESVHRRLLALEAMITQILGGPRHLPRVPYGITVESDVPVVVQIADTRKDGRAAQGMTLGTWVPVSSLF